MLKYHRAILSELCSICDKLGGELDYTSTHVSKLKDRQKAHRLVNDVLYGVLVDVPANEERKNALDKAYESLDKLKELTKRTYPDSKGFLKPEEAKLTNPK